MKINLNQLLIILFLFLFAFAHGMSDVSAHGMSDAEKQTILKEGNLQFLEIGAIHILKGYDHLLFVFGFVFYFRNFLDVIKYITSFTIGHSVTLITATLIGVTLNYHLIDAVIALSVCYIGYENIDGFKKFLKKSPSLIYVVFLFGLIHGLGLSTRLQQLPLGEEEIILKILYFNLGIELGQIGALCLMIGLLIKWRNTEVFLKIRTFANNGLIFFGFLLFLMQMHGYLHTTYPDDFGFPDDSHFHAHEDISSQNDFAGSEYKVSPDVFSDILTREDR